MEGAGRQGKSKGGGGGRGLAAQVSNHCICPCTYSIYCVPVWMKGLHMGEGRRRGGEGGLGGLS